MWAAFMDELRAIHLHAAMPERSVRSDLQSAYERVAGTDGAVDLLGV
jgi:hypothetical protein